MSDAGYTATEALAALAILGLAVGGLAVGLAVIGHGQMAVAAKVSDAVAIRSTASALKQLVFDQGPFRSDALRPFTGNARQFSFPCGARMCGARLTGAGLVLAGQAGAETTVEMKDAADLRFSYVGSATRAASWPSAPPPLPAPQWELLRTILLNDRSGEAVTSVDVVTEQPADCDFDTIVQDCRKAAS